MSLEDRISITTQEAGDPILLGDPPQVVFQHLSRLVFSSHQVEVEVSCLVACEADDMIKSTNVDIGV